MPKITITGGASAFTDALVRDFLSLDLPSGTLGLVDIDKRRLELAGKSVQKIVEANEDKIRSLLHKRLPTVAQQKFQVKIENGKLEVEIPEEAFFLEGLQVEKRTLTADVEKYLSKIETISFIEIFKKPAPSAEVKPVTEAPPAETTPLPQPP